MNDHQPAPGASEERRPQVSVGRVEILLAEDNHDDVKLALHAFRKNNLTNAIHVVSDGAEALEFLFCTGAYRPRNIEDPPKVILLDLKMPLVDGLEVVQQIRADERTRTLPVVMMTASREESDRIASYKLGINSYIVKPMDFEQFVEAMRLVGMYWVLLNQAPKG